MPGGLPVSLNDLERKVDSLETRIGWCEGWIQERLKEEADRARGRP